MTSGLLADLSGLAAAANASRLRRENFIALYHRKSNAEARLADLHRQHRNRSAIYALDRKRDGLTWLPGGDYIEHWQVVIRRGDGEHRILPEGFIVDERLVF